MDFLGVEKAFQGNKLCEPGTDTRLDLAFGLAKKRSAAMHSLSRIKPHMMHQVLSLRSTSSEERNSESSEGCIQVPSQMDPPARGLMELFPKHAGSATKNNNILPPLSVRECGSVQAAVSALNTAQLTIFYNGTVNVYDVTADKAQAIMRLASNGDSSPSASFDHGSALSNSKTRTPASGTTEGSKPLSNAEINKQLQVRKSHTDLPIARKLSLQRFLEKRKNRVNDVAPYSTAKDHIGLSMASSLKSWV